jgi:hypothetical protein
MISAATGAMALLMITLVRDHGLQYLFAATILTGVLQVLFGVFKLGRYMKFVPRAVMVGFVNALAILIFLAQLPQFMGAGWLMYAFVRAGLAIIYLLPRITTASVGADRDHRAHAGLADDRRRAPDGRRHGRAARPRCPSSPSRMPLTLETLGSSSPSRSR